MTESFEQPIQKPERGEDKNRPVEKPSIKKGWKEQLSDSEIEHIKEWAQRVVKQWHDEVHPDYIFLTETSAILYGYVLKETWKEAYSDEKPPRFYRINPSSYSVGNPTYMREALKGEKITDAENYLEEIKAYLPQTQAYLHKRINKENPVIIVFDEGFLIDDLFDEKEHENRLTNLPPDSLMPKEWSGRRSLIKTTNFLHYALKELKPTIFGSQQAIHAILKNKNESKEEYRDHFYSNEQKSRSPTSKGWASSNRLKTDDEQLQLHKLWDNVGFTGQIVKHPEQRKRAIEYVDELKDLGKEAGLELKKNTESESSDEITEI